ncbi:MAG: hypothetical protein NT023_22135 [Armatimonadetes bacterium]|nr:hypothetical protein [Armatimonadota bacterium]
MGRTLLILAFSVGAIGALTGICLALFFRAKAKDEQGKAIQSAANFGWLLLVVGYLFTMMSKPPLFSTGQALSKAILMGGEVAFLTYFVARKLSRYCRENGEQPLFPFAITTGLFLTSMIAAVPLIWFRDSLYDSMMGLAIGWTAMLLPVAGALLRGSKEDRRVLTPLALGTGYLLTLVVIVMLCEDRAPISLKGGLEKTAWSSIVLIIAVAVPFLLTLITLPNGLLARLSLKLPMQSLFTRLCGHLFPGADGGAIGARVGQLVVAGGLLLLLVKGLCTRFALDILIFKITLMGLGMGILIWWLIADRARKIEKFAPTGWQHNMVAVLVLIALNLTAFRLYAGLGIGLLLIGCWLPVSFAVLALMSDAQTEDAPTPNAILHLLRLMLFAVILYTYRLYDQRFSKGWADQSYDYYRLLALLVGAVSPVALATYLCQESGSKIRAVIVGACAVAVPLLCIYLFDSKVALWLLWGVALGVLFTEGQTLHPLTQAETSKETALPVEAAWIPIIVATIFCVAQNQWSGLVLEHSLATNSMKIKVLAYIFGTLGVLALLNDYGQRFLSKRRSEPQGGK